MSADARTDHGQRVGWIACGLALLLIIFGVVHDLPPIWRLAMNIATPTLGYRPAFNCAGLDGTCTVPDRDNRGAPSILPGSPLDLAGLKVGDRVRFDRPYDNLRSPRVGEAIGLTIWHGQQARHVIVTAIPG